MTIQLSQIEVNEPRLFQESSNSNRSDLSFQEKLEFEKARLGLLFSPFSQLESLLSSAAYGYSENGENRPEQSIYSMLEQPKTNTRESRPASQSPVHSTAPQVFESIPLASFNRQFIQQLLARTNWLVPNLEAKPLFYQAFAEGTLTPKFDLQSLIDQIVEQIKLVKGKDKAELSLTLKPEEMGKIFLTFTSQAGAVSIQIMASADTKKLIDSQREELERALRKAHVHFDDLVVTEVKEHV